MVNHIGGDALARVAPMVDANGVAGGGQNASVAAARPGVDAGPAAIANISPEAFRAHYIFEQGLELARKIEEMAKAN